MLICTNYNWKVKWWNGEISNFSLFVQGCPPGEKEYGPARGQPLRDVETPHQDRGRCGQGYYA